MSYHLTLDMALTVGRGGCTVLFGYRCTFVDDVSGEGSALAVLELSLSVSTSRVPVFYVCATIP